MGQLAPQAHEADAAAEASTAIQTPLFGGALSAAIPPRLADVSLARPVPDHQEVFSDPSVDQALVVELLEHSGDVPDGEGAARFYFEDLAEQNEAAEGARLLRVEALKSSSASSSPSSSSQVFLRGLAASPPPPAAASSASNALEACTYAALAIGTASIAKGRSSSNPSTSSSNSSNDNSNNVSLALALLRFPAVGSDLLVSLTTATELGSSSIGSALVPADLGNRAPAEIAAEAERLLLAVASSLEVRDWGLFS